MKRYALFVGSPYDSDHFGWGAFHASYDDPDEAERDGQALAARHRNGGAFHVVDLRSGAKVYDSR